MTLHESFNGYRTRLQMNFHVCLGNKPLGADGATPRLLTGMRLDVVSVRSPMREFFAAIHAHIRFLSSVHPHVSSQYVLRDELPRADSARERLVPGVDPQVLLELGVAG